METIREVLKRFGLDIDLTDEVLDLEVRGGYTRYEIEQYDEYDDENVGYFFISDRQSDDNGFEFIATLQISPKQPHETVWDCIQPDLNKPCLGKSYDAHGRPGPIT